MSARGKSPKQSAPKVESDPEMHRRAKQAMASHSKKKEDLLDKYAYHIVFGILILLVVVALVHSFWKSGPDVYTTEVNDEIYINKLNSLGLSFKVGPVSMFANYKLVDVKKIVNVQNANKNQLYNCNSKSKEGILPDSYNFRVDRANCSKKIYSQGNCSSSYSIAAVSAVSDRICQSTNGEDTFEVSPHAPVFCDKFINSQCKAGFISRTLDYGKMYGFVDTNCLPYNPLSAETTEQCAATTKDCRKITVGDYCVASQSQNIKLQIYHYGPVVATIPIYRDFLIYKEGVYQVYPKNQRFSTEHAVKIIGWDVINEKQVWIIENSWGQDWGVNGTAYVIAGSAELRIQRFTLAIALNTPEVEEVVEQQLKQAEQSIILDGDNPQVTVETQL